MKKSSGSFKGLAENSLMAKMQNGERRENSGAKAALGLWNEQKKGLNMSV